MKTRLATRTTRSPWLGLPQSRTAYDRRAPTFAGPVGFMITVALVLAVGLDGWSGWFIVGWMPVYGWMMSRNHGIALEECEELGHVPFLPIEGRRDLYCARCDEFLGLADVAYVAPEVASAAADVHAARREGKPEPQSKWSDRR